jgi:DNA-directed RNA polymerase subunit omega
MNSELSKRALEKIVNPNILVNLVSKRVRQLNSGGGGGSRPLIADTGAMGAGDIALAELVEDKMGWERIESLPGEEPAPKRKRKS